jgi:hypothetical protein
MNPFKEEMARITNKEKQKGTLADAVVGADVLWNRVFHKGLLMYTK